MGKLDDAARARLKAAGDRVRGRKSLIGLDVMGWASSLDAVQEGRVTCPAVMSPEADGSVIRDRTAFSLTFDHSLALRNRPRRADFAALYDGFYRAELAYQEALKEWSAKRERIPWLRIMYARPNQHEDLARYVPTHAIGVKTWHRDRQESVNERVTLYRPAPVFALFCAIWPDRWTHFAAKYLRGYTLDAAAELEWVDYTKPETIPGYQAPGWHTVESGGWTP